MIKIQKKRNGENITDVDYKCIKFPGGELHPKINAVFGHGDMIRVTAHITSSDDIMELLMVKDAIDNLVITKKVSEVSLDLTYLPYSRQDRVAGYGECHGVKVMCQLINSMNFDTVTCYDLHSDVPLALINNLIHVDQVSVVKQIGGLHEELEALSQNGKLVFVSPDAGALKKTMALAKEYNASVVIGSKHRDVQTGELTGFSVDDMNGHIWDSDVFVVDDICDGGGTFIGLADALYKGYPKTLNLVITNGIYSKGKRDLIASYNAIHTKFDWTE